MVVVSQHESASSAAFLCLAAFWNTATTLGEAVAGQWLPKSVMVDRLQEIAAAALRLTVHKGRVHPLPDSRENTAYVRLFVISVAMIPDLTDVVATVVEMRDGGICAVMWRPCRMAYFLSEVKWFTCSGRGLGYQCHPSCSVKWVRQMIEAVTIVLGLFCAFIFLAHAVDGYLTS